MSTVITSIDRRSPAERYGIKVGEKYGITPFVTTEITGAGQHKNCFTSSVPVLRYDERDEISEEEAMTRRLEDRSGTVVCEYLDRNQSVVSMQYTPKDGTILPITVFTNDDLQEARQTAAVRHVIFGAAYCIECLAIVLVYFKKRAK